MIFLSVFRSQKFKGLWLERIKKSIYIVLIYEKNRFSVILFSSQSWSTRLYAHSTFSILILTNWQKKKKKKKNWKLGLFSFFHRKTTTKIASSWFSLYQNEANYCHFETYLCKYFSFVYCFLSSADYDFFPTVSAFHLNPFGTIKRNIVIAILRRYRIQILIKQLSPLKQWGKAGKVFFFYVRCYKFIRHEIL